jgi:NADH-quinone oxidoreductase subunit M
MDFEVLRAWPRPANWPLRFKTHLGPISLWLALAVLLGFAVKVPLMPFHTWLPATYSKAPRR